MLLHVGVLMKREVLQFLRRPLRVVGLLMGPLMWLVVFGLGMRRALNISIQGFDYVHFILPGILGMNLLTASSRGGLSVLRDRQAGFLKEVLVAPVSRTSILLGVSLGVTTRAVIQGALLIGVGYLLGVRLGPTLPDALATLAALVLLLYVLGLGLINLGIAIAWRIEDVYNFGTVSNWIVFPLFLLSGAIYPLSRLPPWLEIPIRLNPLTYGVDALRHVTLGPSAASFPLGLDLAVIGGILLMGLGLGSAAVRRSAEQA